MNKKIIVKNIYNLAIKTLNAQLGLQDIIKRISTWTVIILVERVKKQTITIYTIKIK